MMDELFEQFMIEGRELVSQATEDLLALERDPASAGRIDSAFRSVHTLKGSVAIFELAPMGATLHAAEELLATARAGTRAIDVGLVEALLGCIDQCDRWMDDLAETGVLPTGASKLAFEIATALAVASGLESAPEVGATDAGGLWLAPLLDREEERIRGLGANAQLLVAIRYIPREDCFFSGDDPLAFAFSIPELASLHIAPREPWPPVDECDPYRCNLVIEALSSAALADVRQIFRFIPDQVTLIDVPASLELAPEKAIVGPELRMSDKTIRVDAGQIDALLDIVGELVVGKNELVHLASEAEAGADPRTLAAAIRANHARTERMIAAMHRTVMSMRMVPLDRVFRRLGRPVRELAARLSREIDFSVRGGDTRVDKAIVDSLFEPLLHIVRNALDHGIEEGSRREKLGKPAKGQLVLTARASGDEVLIDVSDDGAGIDAGLVRRIAAERGLMPDEQLAGMDDAAIGQLIFAPGFSTADEVTDISGRGVGMDAVKVAIERLGGRISLATDAGVGTCVSLRLPATASLMTVLIIEASGDRFAVPLDLVRETLRIPKSRIVPLGSGEAFVHRGRTVPFVHLGTLLGLGDGPEADTVSILVADDGHGPIAVAVDAFSERLEVMLRPMTGLLAEFPGVAGTTLLGDGSVLLILNLSEVLG